MILIIPFNSFSIKSDINGFEIIDLNETFSLGCYEELLKRCEMVPKERYPYIMTTSQEYGWHCPKVIIM